MGKEGVVRKVLGRSGEFKAFWRQSDPYRFALTSREYPPVLLQEEEWLFSNEIKVLLKELMQYDQRKMKVVKAPFNPANKGVLRPDELSEWKIVNFPEEWSSAVCDLFVPQGHLTRAVLGEIPDTVPEADAATVEDVFFTCLEREIEQLGYVFFTPRKGAKRAAVQSYLKEWETDEAEAGL